MGQGSEHHRPEPPASTPPLRPLTAEERRALIRRCLEEEYPERVKADPTWVDRMMRTLRD